MDIPYKQLKIIAKRYGYRSLQTIAEAGENKYTAYDRKTGKQLTIVVPVPFDKDGGRVWAYDEMMKD